MKKPNLFLVGCGRSGTTSLYRFLSQHPQIFMSEVKGPDFFADFPNDGFPQFFGNEKKYLELFASAKTQMYLGDASHYFHVKKAPERIRKFNPNSKIIIILRNPIDVIRSHYKGGVIDYDTKLTGKNAKNMKNVKELVDSLNYSENIRRWVKNFGKENVKVIIFEDMIKDPKKILLELCEFLGIEYSDIPEYKPYIDSANSNSGLISKIIQKSPLWLRIMIKKILGREKTEGIRGKLDQSDQEKDSSPARPIPPLSQKLKNKIKREITATEKILGRKLEGWSSSS